ncbi:hypothetical protein MMC25_000603 [Agyrium rufum]|nr:hypothetical protein [Agyrium rufum]
MSTFPTSALGYPLINTTAQLDTYLILNNITDYFTADYKTQQILSFYSELCNLTIPACPLVLAQQDYVPSLGANAFFAAIYGICMLINLFFGIRYKTWGFVVGMTCGLILEIAGYIGRIILHNNPFPQGGFLLYLVCLTIGPAFLTAAIYLCLARIITAYNEKLVRFQPRVYTITFMCNDFFALVLQGAGGGLASTGASGSSTQKAGINLLIAGLAFQVFSLVVFIVLATDVWWSLRKSNGNFRSDFAELRVSFRFRGFIYSIAAATILILVRSTYRVAELSQGFSGTLANNETDFIVLEGVMVVVAVLCLTAFNPGNTYRGQWHAANFSVRGKKNTNLDGSMMMVEGEKDVSGSPEAGSMEGQRGGRGHAFMSSEV